MAGLNNIREAYSKIYSQLDERMSDDDKEMRRLAAQERRAGNSDRLDAKIGAKYAESEKKSAEREYKKSKGKHIHGMADSVEVEGDLVDEGMTLKGFKENRRKNKRREDSVDAERRGHVSKDIITHGRKYSPDEAKSRRAKMSDDERAARHRSAVDPDDDRETNYYSADKTKNPKKLRKQKAMGEIGESHVPGKLPMGHAAEEFELWVDALVEEGYDLSDYTWDEMYEFYLNEDAGIVSGLVGLALGAKGAYNAAKKTKRMRDYPKNFVKGIVDPRTYVPKKKKEQKKEFEIEEGKRGLWDNIHAKRARGERPAKPGEKGYPKTLNVEELDQIIEGIKQARKNVGASKCWTGKRLGNPATKMKGGKEVPNCVPEEVEIQERTLDTAETGEKERLVQGMKKSAAKFKERYGKRANSVIHATATKMAKRHMDTSKSDRRYGVEEETSMEENADLENRKVGLRKPSQIAKREKLNKLIDEIRSKKEGESK